METLQKYRRPHIPYLLPAGISLIVIVFGLLGQNATEFLRYEAPLIKEGELWRIVTGHFVHLGWSHLVLNLLGLGLIWGLFYSTFNNFIWLLVTLISAIVISLAMLWLNPQLVWYVGLSGVLHALFVAGAVGGIRRGDWREAILLAAIIGKLLWEQVYGALPGTADMAGGPVIVDAHLYGAIAGALTALFFKPKRYCDT